MPIVLDGIDLMLDRFKIPHGYLPKHSTGEEYGVFKHDLFRKHKIRCRVTKWRYLKICFSVSQLLSDNGHNIHIVGLADFKKVLVQVQNLMTRSGIKADLIEAKPHRIDVARDRVMKFPFKRYKPLFEMLPFPHKKSDTNFDTTVYLRNRQHEMNIYDKSTHLKLEQKNLLRLEHRITTYKKVRDTYHFKTVQDVLDNYESLEKKYEEFLSGILFFQGNPTNNSIPQENLTEVDRELERLKGIKEKNSRNAFLLWLAESGIQYKAEIFGGIDSIFKTVENVGIYSKSNLCKTKMKMFTSYPTLCNTSEATLTNLLYEIQEKFLCES